MGRALGAGAGGLVAAVAALAAVIVGATPAWASNDTYFDRQWALQQVHAPQAWSLSTGAGITIGIVDTGIDGGHPDLAGKVVAYGDCVGHPCTDGATPDTHGHGTIVSGIAAAVTNNGIGVAGMAPGAKLAVAKVLNATGEGRVDDINAGIRWVVDHGARVVNLSLGDPNFQVTSLLGTPLRTGIEYAWTRGAIPVLAAGNYADGAGNLGSENYGNLDAVVVGATDRYGNVPSYSSAIGTAKWGLVAPGGAGGGGADGNVISTWPTSAGGTGYAAAGGTSMAAPHVAGTLALLLAQGLNPTAAVSRLLATADKVPCGQGCQGRLNAATAVGASPTTPAAFASPPPATAAPAAAATTPGTRASAPPSSRPTTTTPDPTTTTPATTPVAPAAATTDAAAPAPPAPAAVASQRRFTAPKPPGRNPALLVLAAALVVGMGGAVGRVAAERFRAAVTL